MSKKVTHLSEEQLNLYIKHSNMLVTASSDTQQLLISKYKLSTALAEVDANIEKITIVAINATNAVNSLLQSIDEANSIVEINRSTGEIIYKS